MQGRHTSIIWGEIAIQHAIINSHLSALWDLWLTQPSFCGGLAHEIDY